MKNTLAKTCLWTAFAVSLLCQDEARADRIYLQDGRVLEGEVVQQYEKDGQTLINVRVGEARLTLPQKNIIDIQETSIAEDKLAATRRLFLRRDWHHGFKTLAEARRAGAAHEDITAQLILFEDQISRDFTELSIESLQTLQSVVDAIPCERFSQQPTLFYFHLALAIRMKEASTASTLIEQWQTETHRALPFEAWNTELAKLSQERIESSWEMEDFAASQAWLDALCLLKPELCVQWQAVSKLRQARYCYENRQYAQAIELYVQLTDAFPELALERLKNTLTLAESTYSAEGHAQDAIALYEQYGLAYHPSLAKERLVFLWRNRGAQLCERGRIDEAREAYQTANAYEPGSARIDLLRCDYLERRDEYALDDPLAQFELGVWCLENELVKEALDAFGRARDDALVGKNAEEYIYQIRLGQAEEGLHQILNDYDQGNYHRVLSATHHFLQQPYAPGYREQARKIEELTKEAIRLREAERPQQAQALFQQAQRAFMQKRYSETDELLHTLLERYDDTLIAPRAREFYREVQRELMIGMLEEGLWPGQRLRTEDDSITTPTTAQDREIYRLLDNLKQKASAQP